MANSSIHIQQSLNQPGNKTNKNPSVKSLLKDLEKEELTEVILELCKLSTKNKQFLQLFIQGSNQSNLPEILTEAKKKLKSIFFHKSGYPEDRIDLRKARSIISEYSKVFKEYPEAVIELKVYFVELGVDVIDGFGDMYESFYDSLSSMLANACGDLKKHSQYFNVYFQRLNTIREKSAHSGWGFDYVVANTIADLEDFMNVDYDE
jgi:hypothetical protein